MSEQASLCLEPFPLKMSVACDTPLGVEFVTLAAEECELVSVVEIANGRLMWPRSDSE